MMAEPRQSPSLPRAMLLSAALHGLLLLIPYSFLASPLGEPQSRPAGVRLPLQVKLRPVMNAPKDSQLSVTDAPYTAPAPTETTAAAPPAPEAPAGQPQGEEASPPTYFPFKALTREPEALGELQPHLPPLPGGAGGKGQLTLRIWINASGDIDRIQALEGNLTEAYRQPVMDAFAKMTFRPGEIGHLPVASWTDVVIDIPAGSP